MAFIKIDNFAGQIYVPDNLKDNKKHDCEDCFSCQFCSDDRCELCLKKKCCKKESSDE